MGNVDLEKVLPETNEMDKKDAAVGRQSLPTALNESCPKFRILIIGESGVGKSSLLSDIFGIENAGVNDTERGEANVEQEYVARTDDRFVIHDSCGFESGDHRNLDATCDFIARRRQMEDLKDQLHAIWLCLEIPYAGARLVEAGVEKFLKKKQEVLGRIPLIVVYTKLDLLRNMLCADALQENKLLPDDILQEQVSKSLVWRCFEPVEKMSKNSGFPSVTVSTKKGYEKSLVKLLKDTTEIVERYLNDEVATTKLAGRVNTLKLR